MWRTLKPTFDCVIAIIIVCVTMPILALVALLIKLDGGPVFFTQKRLGRGGHQFTIFKFRSMIVDADRFLDECGMPTQDRVTKIGRFLRKTSLDELPQLFNILHGDMSLVGPRPTLPSHMERYTPKQKRRFDVRPGITGLAQVMGRNELPWSRRLELDARYVEEFGFLLDIKILFNTIAVVLLSRGVSIDRNANKVDDLK